MKIRQIRQILFGKTMSKLVTLKSKRYVTVDCNFLPEKSERSGIITSMGDHRPGHYRPKHPNPGDPGLEDPSQGD